MDDRFCRVHVDGPSGTDELRARLAEATGGTLDPRTVELPEATLLVKRWDEHQPTAKLDFPEGYLYFPFTVEPLWHDDVDLDGAVNVVARLLETLWAGGWAAVAVCEYADRLPHAGGYAATGVPWPNG
jgi:hypothetical protein